MSYYEDFIDQHIGEIPDMYEDMDCNEISTYTKYIIEEVVKETIKAKLINFGSCTAWIPNSVSTNLCDTSIEILDGFTIKDVNELKEITFDFLKELK